MKGFKQNKLSMACQLALLTSVSMLSFNSIAQESPAQQNQAEKDVEVKAEEQTEIIEIVGFRASEQAARDMKKEAVGVVDAIIAEDIGKMPDANIAEALQRITGVAITRTEGEGSQVSIRGMGPALNRISINGKTLTSSGDDQGVNLESFDSGLLEKVEVFKTPSASMVEGSLGGSINLKTRRALDNKGRKIAFKAGADYSDLVEKTSPKFEINYVDQFFDRKFGFSGGINYEKRYLRNDGFNVDGYFMPTSVTGEKNGAKGGITDSAEGTLYTLPEGHPDRFLNGEDLGPYGAARPKSLKYTYSEKERERIGAAATFEYRPNDSTEIIFDTTYSVSEEDYFSNQFSASIKQMAPSSMVLNENNTVLAGDAYLYGEDGLPDSRTYSSHNSSNSWATSEKDTLVVGLEVNKNFDSMRLSGAIGYSQTNVETPESFRMKYDLVDKVAFGIDSRLGDVPSIIQHGDFNNSMLDPNGYVINAVTSNTNETDDDELAVQIDLDYDFDFSLAGIDISLLEFGIRYTDRTKDRHADSPRFTQNAAGVGGYNWNHTMGDEGAYIPFHADNFLNDASGNTITAWPVVDLDGALAAFGTSKEELQGLKNSIPSPVQAYEINEKTGAAYAQVNFSNGDDTLVGNFGVRVVRTETDSTGGAKIPRLIVDENGDPILDDKGRFTYEDEFVVKTYENDYTEALPSLNLRYSFTEDTLMRFAVGRVMARPTFGEVAPKVTVSYGAGTPKVTRGNPYLKPYISDQADISLEHYMGKTGMIGLGLFYKDMEDYIQKITTIDTYPLVGPCIPAPNDDAYQDEDGCQLFETKQPLNGPSSEVKGVEFNFYKDLTFLPGALANLSTKFNYTYSDSDAILTDPTTGKVLEDASFPLEGLSKDTTNTTLAYEGENFFVRLSHNYRSEYLMSAFGSQSNTQYRKSYQQYDLSASYNLTKKIKLTLQGVNLTDEVNESYFDQLPYWEQLGTTERMKAYDSSGRRYRLSISGKF